MIPSPRSRHSAVVAAGAIVVFALGAGWSDGVVLKLRVDDLSWEIQQETAQRCALHWAHGMERMILMVETAAGRDATRAVWLVPLPCLPKEASIEVARGFPRFAGDDLVDAARKLAPQAFDLMRVSQVWPLAELLWRLTRNGLWMQRFRVARSVDLSGVEVHQHVSKLGLTAELLSATNLESLKRYLKPRGVTLPDETQAALHEYLRRRYSFAVCWVSAPAVSGNASHGSGLPGATLGLRLTFRTRRAYFPLKLTAMYGDVIVPVEVFLTGLAPPEVFREIRNHARVAYFRRSSSPADYALQWLTGGDGRDTPRYYTRIRLSAPARAFTHDLWGRRMSARGLALAFFSWPAAYLFLHLLCSCLASLAAGQLVFRTRGPLALRFFCFGLWNLLTLAAFAIAARRFKVASRFCRDPDRSPRSKLVTPQACYLMTFSLLYVISTAAIQWGAARALHLNPL